LIWEKEEDLTDLEFIEYWTPGKKIKPLPIIKGKINMFLYLYFSYLNPPDKNEPTSFTIKHKDTEVMFNIIGVQGKKGKIKASSECGRLVKTNMGVPLYAI
jgi:hypothetical protein